GVGLATRDTGTAQEGLPKNPPAPEAASPKAPASKPAADRPETAIAQALEAADRMEDKQLRVRVLADLAAAQAGLGGKAAARKTFAKASELAGTLEVVISRSVALNALAGAQWRAGERDAAAKTFKEAIELAQAREDPDQARHAVMQVALARHECGDLRGARK